MAVKQIIYSGVPKGEVKDDGSTFKSGTVDLDIKTVQLNGGVLLKVLELSCDPYLRGKMRAEGTKSYTPALAAGKPMNSIGIAAVERSDSDKFKEGSLVMNYAMDWQEYYVVPADALGSLVPIQKNDKIPLSVYLSALGMPGRTSFTSFYDIGKPKKGESIFVTAASGAVGQLVVQLAKLEGLRVIATAGSDEKLAYVKTLDPDAVLVNYKTEDVGEALKKFGPVDIMYDNVGGEQLDAYLINAATFGRVIACGAISAYNGEPTPIKNSWQVVPRRLTIRGFIQGDYGQEWTERFRREMGAHLAEGRIKSKEYVVEGLENGPRAFVDMMSGKNFGKTVVRVAEL